MVRFFPNRSVLLIALALAISTQCSALEMPAILSGKSSVKDIITHFRAQMSALIMEAGAETRVTMLRAFQLSESLIGSLEAAYERSLDLTLEKLDEQQIKAFSDTNNLLDGIRKDLKRPAERAVQLGNDAAQITADIFSWSKKPLVTAYGPGFIAPSIVSKEIRITVVGARLHARDVPKPVLRLGNTDIAADEINDSSLGFVVPHSMLATTASGTSFRKANLTLFRDPGGWKSWWPWADWGKVEFPLIFTALPEKLGSYTVRTVARDSKVETENLQSEYIEITKNGGGGDKKVGCVVPKLGFKFDINSARLFKTKHTAYKDNDTSPGTNVANIDYYEGIKTPDRICFFVWAWTGCKECGGTTGGHMTVAMVKTVDFELPLQDVNGELNWLRDKDVELKDDAASQIIEITMFDETSTIVSPSAPYSTQFLRMEADPRNRKMYLRPQRDWSSK